MDYTKMSCEDFVEVLASKAPVPGGGGAAALVGALGMALGSMVGSLTVGKPKFADVEADVAELMRQAAELQSKLLELVKRDAEVFEPLSRAYGMPTETEEQKAEKARVMEECLQECCAVPLEIMKRCAEAIDLHEQFGEKGTAIAISDVGCGVICCKAALQSASLNVFINTKWMEDKRNAEAINAEADQILQTYLAKADAIFADVEKRFR
ncbi:MAG: cyclodeaminase/cyclohydrolase family protein [Coriobacteriia bacterium]|nr:cyclodeaminase/cyclohydrolase family protein [Coriobacteriia bacterium]MCL2750707.1 cyclodeaminase/cyclohydrolase family protein [Coriobacteriia bacterium]